MPEAQRTNTEDEGIEAEAASERTEAEYVSRAPRRRLALDRLVEGPASAKSIADDRAVGASAAAEGLDELFAREMVEVLLDDDPRVYGITPKGEQAIYRLQENQSV